MEWCLDVWHDNYQGAPAQAVLWEKGGDKAYRVARGGSWGDPSYECRSAFRHKHAAREQLPTLGFRVVVVVKPATKST
jgi:formylglycine-generating enzyme required for sulfatase activity